MARRNFNTDKIAAFSKVLYSSRQALAYELPGTIAIESPSTDKDAAVLVHAGTADYLGDNTKSFFDKYGDQIFYGMLIVPVIGSGLAGVAGYFRADKNTGASASFIVCCSSYARRARSTSVERTRRRCRTRPTPFSARPSSRPNAASSTRSGIATFTLAIDQARRGPVRAAHAAGAQAGTRAAAPDNAASASASRHRAAARRPASGERLTPAIQASVLPGAALRRRALQSHIFVVKL